MKFFIDTANLEEILTAQDMGILDGVTTNPSLMAKEGITGKENILNHYSMICDIVNDNVSAEVIATDFKGIVEEGITLSKISPKIVVKVPIIPAGIKAIKYFSEKGIKTNCTLIFSSGQAILAAKAGATFISPFIGRLDDIAQDGMKLVSQIAKIFNNYHFSTQILGASIRHTIHLIQCAEAGIDVVTCPLKVITQLTEHPLTDKGLELFLSDHFKGNQ